MDKYVKATDCKHCGCDESKHSDEDGLCYDCPSCPGFE